jgi:hypothetical protein
MAEDLHLPFEYHQHEVVPAQRSRFLRSSRLRLIFAVWMFAVIYLAAPMIVPQWFPMRAFNNWATILSVTMVFLVAVPVIAIAMPWIDFRFNPLWRQKFVLHVNANKLRLNLQGQEKGLDIPWDDIRHVLEDPHAYVLTMETDRDFLLLPRSAFADPGQERHFRNLLRTRAALPEEERARLTD